VALIVQAVRFSPIHVSPRSKQPDTDLQLYEA
jgi:hypothetical protein